MPIQWTKDLALGIPDLDAQHLELDRQLGLVHDAICEERVPDVPAVLAGVRTCASRHFACEEAYMARCGYAALEEHQSLHRRFMGQLALFEDASAREGVTIRLAMEIGDWLARWVREHQRHDLKLADHVRTARGSGSGGAAP